MFTALKSVVVAMLLALAGTSAMAQASGSFDCITDNSAASCSQGESTLSWTWDGSNFAISNAGSGYVAEVYFDLGSGMSVSFVDVSGDGVVFSSGASPGALPGGTAVSFASDAAFDSDAGGGQPVNGINPGESAVFSISGASSSSFDAGSLASGIHVRSLYNGQSESFVTTPVSEPSTNALMLAGIAAVGFMARRRRRS